MKQLFRPCFNVSMKKKSGKKDTSATESDVYMPTVTTAATTQPTTTTTTKTSNVNLIDLGTLLPYVLSFVTELRDKHSLMLTCHTLHRAVQQSQAWHHVHSVKCDSSYRIVINHSHMIEPRASNKSGLTFLLTVCRQLQLLEITANGFGLEESIDFPAIVTAALKRRDYWLKTFTVKLDVWTLKNVSDAHQLQPLIEAATHGQLQFRVSDSRCATIEPLLSTLRERANLQELSVRLCDNERAVPLMSLGHVLTDKFNLQKLEFQFYPPNTPELLSDALNRLPDSTLRQLSLLFFMKSRTTARFHLAMFLQRLNANVIRRLESFTFHGNIRPRQSVREVWPTLIEKCPNLTDINVQMANADKFESLTVEEIASIIGQWHNQLLHNGIVHRPSINQTLRIGRFGVNAMMSRGRSIANEIAESLLPTLQLLPTGPQGEIEFHECQWHRGTADNQIMFVYLAGYTVLVDFYTRPQYMSMKR